MDNKASLIITRFFKTYRWNSDIVKKSLKEILDYNKIDNEEHKCTYESMKLKEKHVENEYYKHEEKEEVIGKLNDKEKNKELKKRGDELYDTWHRLIRENAEFFREHKRENPYSNTLKFSYLYIIHNCTDEQFEKILPLFINFTFIEGQGTGDAQPVPINLSGECFYEKDKDQRVFCLNLIVNCIKYGDLELFDDLYHSYNVFSFLGKAILNILE